MRTRTLRACIVFSIVVEKALSIGLFQGIALRVKAFGAYWLERWPNDPLG
jgi:hypothetical protein